MAKVFAGPLCRFYARPGRDPMHLLEGLAAWREELMDALRPKPHLPMPWGEDPRAETLWCDLGPAGFPALRLFAFYAERSDFDLPDTVPPLLELDQEWRQAADGRFATSKYGHLLAATVWLPGDFPFTARVPMPDGEMAEFGSLQVLRDQLRFLNARTFQADAAAIDGWRQLPAEPGGELLSAARRGFASLWAASQFASAHGTPMLLQEP